MAPELPQPRRAPESVTRRAYKVGGSVAIRLPKELADAVGIAPGTPVVFRRKGGAILVEKAE